MIETDLWFQSTHPCGVRRPGLHPRCLDAKVSIHAPLRGATSKVRRDKQPIVSFNPRTPAGCDLGAFLCEWLADCFNPRTPAGCDIRSQSLTKKPKGFNPRTPAGCDLKIKTIYRFNQRFNPRTPAGCDRLSHPTVRTVQQFQSTHPCGVRLSWSMVGE